MAEVVTVDLDRAQSQPTAASQQGQGTARPCPHPAGRPYLGPPSQPVRTAGRLTPPTAPGGGLHVTAIARAPGLHRSRLGLGRKEEWHDQHAEPGLSFVRAVTTGRAAVRDRAA